MTIDEQIGIRLNQFRIEKNISQVALSELVGVQQGFLNQVIKGHKGISAKILINITIAFKDLNVRWIITGVGPMLLPENHYPPPDPDVCTQVQEQPADYLPALDGDVDVLKVLRNHEKRLRALEKK